MAIDITKFSKAAKVQPKPSQIVIYGRNGIGKSSICAPTNYGPGAANPVYLNINNRINHLSVVGNDNVIHTYEDYKDFVKFIITGEHDFKTLVVDTADDMERLIFADIVKKYDAESIDDKVKLPYGAGYVEAVDKWDMFLKAMTMIRDKRNMTIVILAQADIKKQNNPDGDNYDIVCPKLHGSTMKGDATLPLLMAWADVVMYMREEVYTKTDSSGFTDKKKDPKLKAVANGDIFLHTKSAAAYRAKDTYNLPAKIDCSNDAWGQVMNGISSYWAAQAPVKIDPPVIPANVVSLLPAETIENEAVIAENAIAATSELPANNGQIFNLPN